ncbi:MAG TPA: UDP-N-acetylmuramoyl-L-alanyl-D-glutamate--2,6-diaminopimelate ligase [Anaeromyxobacteraceae bacterium]|nr:UDP-N-acetylmuramoyl-L-alanyl-D-glutamate--2,6-diaminopimelate ligase [Anaeromyxobacteraceae bacterium]
MAGTGATGDLGRDPEVAALSPHSRSVAPGTLFFALRGTRADGHDFAAAAARAGAVAVVAERPVDAGATPVLIAPNARRAMALAAANFFGHPGERMLLAGITGTKGKTTVSYLVESAAEAAGVPCGVIGTVTWRWPGASRPASHTTPESTELQSALAEMARAGARLAVLEVSSHALAQERVAGLAFRATAFLNLSRDHLDYHRDFDDYYQAKRRLLAEHLVPDGQAVVNAGDGHGARLAAELQAAGRRVWRFGAAGAELAAREARVGLAGIEAVLETPRGDLTVRSPLTGSYNLENLLAAAGLALGLGLEPGAVARGLSASTGAPGRLERIEKGGVAAFVDYAHTDAALAAACAALRALGPRRLVVVFGCGGDRDRGKRPLMGRAAGAAADLVVVTSDNPRGEDPLSIIQAILPGVKEAGLSRLSPAEARAGQRGYLAVPDRREAIALALATARPGDAVLIAGKGHEDYQIVGAERRHFDDREEARRALGLT